MLINFVGKQTIGETNYEYIATPIELENYTTKDISSLDSLFNK